MEASPQHHLHQGPPALRSARCECSGLEWGRRRAYPVAVSIFGLNISRSARWPAHLNGAPYRARLR